MKYLLRAVSYVLVAVVAAWVTLVVVTGGDNYSKLDELQGVIDNYFVEDADKAQLEDAAAAAMVEALGDRWSYYMTAEEYKDYLERMANAYVGIGVTVTQRQDGKIDIVKVETGSPAEEVGVQPGDVLIGVDGTDIVNMDIDSVKDMVKGKKGTKVSLTLERGEETLELTVERRTIQSVVVEFEMLEGQIGLITIVNFDSRCADETIAAIDTLMDQGAKALLFDVRYNPGGYKSELVKVLDYLLPEGPLFRSVDYSGKEEVDKSDADCIDLPMAVLMNGDSYSAAEFFAAALSEYGVAKLVGEPTTGKGRFQTSFRLKDGSAAVISIGEYCTPKGVSLADVGLTPDIPVEVDDTMYMEIYYGNVPAAEDPQIRAAVEALLAS